MTEYYKALRPDGTDFATGTTKPRKGSWMPRIGGKLVMCERGYHVSDAVAETLVGGSWPCKLARVEVPEGQWQQGGHKLVVPTYRVVEWLPAWQALGPNGQEVATLIARTRRITPGQAERLSVTWYAELAPALAAALGPALAAALGPALAAARAACRDAARAAARDAARDVAWDVAWGPALAAALALVVRDLITPEQFDILYGPWRSVMEETQ